MRKLLMMTAVAGLMAAPAFAAGPVLEIGGSLGGGVSSVSSGSHPGAGESSYAGTESQTSVEAGNFNTISHDSDTTVTNPTVASEVGGTDVATSTTFSKGSFDDSSQSAQAFGGELGGGEYSGTALEGGFSVNGAYTY